MGVGLAIASGRVVVALLIAAYLIVALTIAVKSEEAFLRRAFGDGYDRYRRGGEASRAVSQGDRRFSVAQARANREHRAVIGLLLADDAAGAEGLSLSGYNETFGGGKGG